MKSGDPNLSVSCAPGCGCRKVGSAESRGDLVLMNESAESISAVSVRRVARWSHDLRGAQSSPARRTRRRRSRAGRTESPRVHVYFSVDDLDAAHARAKEAGCRELIGIEVRPWGERSFFARDAFDNPICFVDSQTLFTGEHAWAGAPHTI
jgi:hypothetical protein